MTIALQSLACSTGAPQGVSTRAQAPAYQRGAWWTLCPCCGATLAALHCKRVCRNCGFAYDCSET